MLRRFAIDEGGTYAAIFAVAMVPLVAGVAGIVDFVSTSNRASKLQNSLDATGIAIAAKYEPSMSGTELRQFGSGFFAANIRGGGVSFDDDTPNADKVVDFDAAAVATGSGVEISVSAKLLHDGFIGGPTLWHAWRQSKVRISQGQQPACVLALDEHASDSIVVKGSAQVKFTGCVLASNSDAADSISRAGAGQLAAKCATTVGGTSGLSSSQASLDCGAPLEKQYPSLDPLAGVVPPAYAACQSLPNGKTKALSPGTFCNQTWTGDISLAAGAYILRGGQIKPGGNGSLVGQGVTIFLMEGAEIVVNANEIVNLSPPTSGPYAGITIYQAKGNTAEVKINGTSGSKVSGFIYAPSGHVFVAGNSDMSGAGECLRIVSRTVEMTGNTAIKSDCDAELGGRTMNAGRNIVLVK